MARSEQQITFRFLGFRYGWYALRAEMPAKRKHQQTALEFENQVIEWLIAEQITPHKHSYLGNGNTGHGPHLPADPDGSQLCLMLKRAVDVIRLEAEFRCTGITPEAMLTALQGEAAFTKVQVDHEGIAMVAYDAQRRLSLLNQKKCPSWKDLKRERQTYISTVTRIIEHPTWTAEYEYNDRIKSASKTIPQFDKLPVLQQVKDRLFFDIVRSLSALLRDIEHKGEQIAR